MVQVGIDTNFTALTKNLSPKGFKQLPFAIAKAMTKTITSDVVPAIQNEARRSMDIKKPWVLKGLRMSKIARKEDAPKIQAGFGTKDDVVRQLALGEDREARADKGLFGLSLGVPSSYAKKTYGDQLTRKTMWLDKIIPKGYAPRKTKSKSARNRKNKFFPVKSKRNTRYSHLVLERTGPHKEDVEVVYYVHPKPLKMKKRFMMEKVGAQSFKKGFGRKFPGILRAAITTAR